MVWDWTSEEGEHDVDGTLAYFPCGPQAFDFRPGWLASRPGTGRFFLGLRIQDVAANVVKGLHSVLSTLSSFTSLAARFKIKLYSSQDPNFNNSAREGDPNPVRRSSSTSNLRSSRIRRRGGRKRRKDG